MEGKNWELVLIKTGPAAKLLSWQQQNKCQFVSSVMNISGAKFKEHCFNIFRDIPACLVELEFEDIGFVEVGKPENSIHIWRGPESNPGLIGGRQTLSPPCHPCSPLLINI